jgi:hypothetical protein
LYRHETNLTDKKTYVNINKTKIFKILKKNKYLVFDGGLAYNKKTYVLKNLAAKMRKFKFASTSIKGKAL